MRLAVLVVFILITSFNSFSQNNEINQLVEVVIEERCSDRVIIDRHFENSEFIKDLERIKYDQDKEVMKRSLSDSLEEFNSSAWFLDDTVTVSVGNIQVEYSSALRLLKRKNRDRIKNTCPKSRTTSSTHSTFVVSSPVFSIKGDEAIIYTEYYCGVLCAEGGIVFLRKLNGKWEIVEKTTRWIS